MSNQITLNDQTFPCLSTAGIVAYRCLEFESANKGNVALPGGALSTRFAGISKESQSSAGSVAVAIGGNALAESDGSAVINPGDKLTYVINTGRVKSQALAQGAAAQYVIIGTCVDDAQIPATAGALVTVALAPFITEAA